MKSTDKHKKSLSFKFDVSTFKLLGQELITDRVTALFELVKNSYDANAENVWIEFYDVNPKSEKSKIIIRDDGLGMTYQDIRNKWMIIGGTSNRTEKYSPAPYNRKFIGEKGIGRFAVNKLGAKLLMKTKKKVLRKWEIIEIDWNKYEQKTNNQSDVPIINGRDRYFTDIENFCWTEEADNEEQGTILEITNIQDVWTKEDIKQTYEELAKIVSPVASLKYPFNIYIKSNEYEEYTDVKVKNNAIKHASDKFELSYDMEAQQQEVLVLNNGKLETKLIAKQPMGLVGFTLYYFNQVAKRRFKREYKGTGIDGIKIYRDDLITTPFAEHESKDSKRRDILGIDKRRYSGFFDKAGSRDLIGIVTITKENNPNIKDTTSRQDFIDNKEYRSLKDFILNQLSIFEQYLKITKNKKVKEVIVNLKSATEDLQFIKNSIQNVEKKASSELKPILTRLKDRSQQLQKEVQIGYDQFKKSEKERVRQENLFLSLMSLQEYASEIAHVVRTSLSQIIHLAEFFKRNFPNPELDEIFKVYAVEIYDKMKNLNKAVDFMLSYASSNKDFEKINIKNLIVDLFEKSYQPILKKHKIDTLVEFNQSLILTHNKKFLEDIFENLISNSIKALKYTQDKLIKCSGRVENDKFILHFSDNGIGIEEEDKERVFDIYFTKTEEEGGAGVGLFIVKKRIEALKGSIEVVENELKPSGSTFKIVLPFNS